MTSICFPVSLLASKPAPDATAELAYGDPAEGIIRWVEEKGCDLVAMSTHGHRFLADLFLGTTVHRVRHTVEVPVLLLRHR